MNNPEIQSRTRLWAPNPMAIPAIPAPASNGARSRPSRSATSIRAIVQISADAVLPISPEIASARVSRRGSRLSVVSIGGGRIPIRWN